MTKRFHRRVSGLLPARRFHTDTRYSVDQLDGARQDYAIEREQRHRDADPSDPWLSPAKSEAVRALLILIEFAQAHTYLDSYTPDDTVDLRGFCEDAKLTERQTEVVMMVGEGWGIASIANRLGISRQAVSMHLHKGRGRLVRQIPPLAATLQKLYCVGDELSLLVG